MRRGAAPALRIKFARKAKVSELDVARSIQQQVLRLQISVIRALCISGSMAVSQHQPHRHHGGEHMAPLCWAVMASACARLLPKRLIASQFLFRTQIEHSAHR